MGREGDRSQEAPSVLPELVRRARRISKLRSSSVKSVIQYGDGPITTRYEGVPYGGLQRVDHQGQVTFRHFVRRSPDFDAITTSGELKAGKTPYAQGARGSRTYYDDLTGVFLTSSTGDPREVGVGDSEAYVDVRLHPEVPVFFVSDDIYFIPAKPNTIVPVEIVGQGRLKPPQY